MIIVQSGPSEDPSGKTLKIRMWLGCVKCMLWNRPTNLLGWQDTYAAADILLHETLQQGRICGRIASCNVTSTTGWQRWTKSLTRSEKIYLLNWVLWNVQLVCLPNWSLRSRSLFKQYSRTFKNIRVVVLWVDPLFSLNVIVSASPRMVTVDQCSYNWRFDLDDVWMHDTTWLP